MPDPNWANETMWTGDNLPILRGMNSQSVDLIYLDPPFNSKANYAAPIGSMAAGAEFKDTWTLQDVDVAWLDLIQLKHPRLNRVIDAAMTDSDKSYLVYMAPRLLEMHRVLKPTGSIYLHCDPTMSHYLKLLMDAIWGRRNFRNEIIWCYSTSGRTKRFFAKKHDTILLFTKSDKSYWGDYRIPVSPEYLASHYRQKDENGKQCRIREDAGKVRVYYPDEGMICNDWWEIPYVNSMSKERTGYPTQKPLALLDRIIKASSNEGDMVLDPFCGCATACVAAHNLNRKWVGIDISPKAYELVKRRIQDGGGAVLQPRKPHRRTRTDGHGQTTEVQ
ncbi:MAG: site-specific DNA-methyltransferase [Gemmatimonadota bacterium]|nr:site-specific DNA-methyltransferase [Gemmatimonadota bacterium]